MFGLFGPTDMVLLRGGRPGFHPDEEASKMNNQQIGGVGRMLTVIFISQSGIVGKAVSFLSFSCIASPVYLCLFCTRDSHLPQTGRGGQ